MKKESYLIYVTNIWEPTKWFGYHHRIPVGIDGELQRDGSYSTIEEAYEALNTLREFRRDTIGRYKIIHRITIIREDILLEQDF